jgi:hypothetical protein
MTQSEKYLFFGQSLTYRSGIDTNRKEPEFLWYVDGAVVTARGINSSFNRGDQATESTWFGGSAGGLIYEATANEDLELYHMDHAYNAAGSMLADAQYIQIQGINIPSMLRVTATFTDTVTITESLTFCPHFTDRVYVNDVEQVDNYSPIRDAKPPALNPGFGTGGDVSEAVYPMGDVGDIEWTDWGCAPGNKDGARWQNLDNDVDLTDTTDSVGSGQGEPPITGLPLVFSSLPSDWGVIEDVTFRARHTIGACDSGNGTIEYSGWLYINGDRGGSSLTADARTFIDPAGVTNEIYTQTYTGVNLTVLEFNTIACNFTYLNKDSGGTPIAGPWPTVYAIDIIAARGGSEKDITEDNWTPEKTIIKDAWASEKTIVKDSWDSEKTIVKDAWASEKTISKDDWTTEKK